MGGEGRGRGEEGRRGGRGGGGGMQDSITTYTDIALYAFCTAK